MANEYQEFLAKTSEERDLPVNEIADEHRLVRFVTLDRIEDGERRSVVLPRDLVNPEVARKLKDKLPGLSDAIVKGGSPLSANWKAPQAKKAALEIPVVEIADLEAFAKMFEVTVKGVKKKVDIGADDVHRLAAAPQLVRATDGTMIRLVAKPPSRVALFSSQARMKPQRRRSYSSEFSDGQVSQWLERRVMPKLDLCVYLPYQQTWKLLGYTRGELVHTISLAPQEETSIEIFSWDRIKRTLDDTTTQDFESSTEASFSDKESMEAVKEMSKSNTFSIGIKGEVKIPAYGATIGIGVDNKDEMKSVNKETHNSVTEAVGKAASKISSSRQVKVSESQEVGIERRSTRKIKNQNLTRTLNLDCFEVLVNYEVSLALVPYQVRLCALVPVSFMGSVDRVLLLNHEGTLTRVLLSKSHLPGFSAAKKLSAWTKLCSFKCAPPCSCDVIPPAPPAPVVKSQADIAAAALATAIKELRDAIGGLQDATSDEILHLLNTPWEDIGDDRSEWPAAIVQHQMRLYRNLVLIEEQNSFWSSASNWADRKDDSPEGLAALFLDRDPDLVSQLAPEPGIGDEIEMSLEIPGTWNPTYGQYSGFNDGGLVDAIKKAKVSLDSYQKASTTAAGTTAAQAVVAPPVKEPPIYTAKELAEAQVAEDALLAHIRFNISHYRQAIWNSLSHDDREILLSGIGDLASRVERNALGFVGDRLALPLRGDVSPETAAWIKANIADNAELAEPSTMPEVTLPTRGVTLEARLGLVDAAESFIIEHRRLDVKTKKAEAEVAEERFAQEKEETRRYKARLDATTPLLDDPDPNGGPTPFRVVLEKAETE